MAKTLADAGTRALLVAVADVIVLAEPILLHLWKESGVTLGSLRVLRAVAESPRSPGELTALTGTAPPTMARLLARLEERGLVTRSIDTDDRRRIEVTLTGAGRELLNRSRVLKGSAFQRAAEALRAEEREALVAALNRFTALVRS